MASIDKAAIGFTIAIVAIALGFTAMGDNFQSNPPTASPTGGPSPSSESSQSDPFSELAAEVRESAVVEEMEDVAEEMEDVAEAAASEVEEAMKETTEKMENVAKEMEDVAEEMEDVIEEIIPSGPQTVMVDMPSGTSVPGCEETNECYIPATITINAGDTVEWTNSDTAAHTVTGGSPANGPSGVFDSSLVLGGATYAFTFDNAGTYDYFCMVHPWMVGNVQVN